MSVIPTQNKAALFGYYAAIFSLLPCLGGCLGPIAIVLGAKGLQTVKASPEASGTTHAWVALIVGGMTTLVNVGIALLLFGDLS